MGKQDVRARTSLIHVAFGETEIDFYKITACNYKCCVIDFKMKIHHRERDLLVEQKLHFII